MACLDALTRLNIQGRKNRPDKLADGSRRVEADKDRDSPGEGQDFSAECTGEASTDTKGSTPKNRKPVFGDEDLDKFAQFVNSLQLLCELFQVLLESIEHPERFVVTIGFALVPDGAIVSAKVRRLTVEIKRFFIASAGGRRATLSDIGFHHSDQGTSRLLGCAV